MKKFTKFMLSAAAITTVSAAMAVSAMAMTAEYDDATGKVTLFDVQTTGAQQTLLVLTQDTNVTSENANEIIAQIDQTDDGKAFSEFQLQDHIQTKLEEGSSVKYYIRIGGTDLSNAGGTIQTYTLTISKAGGGEPGGDTEYETIIVGDCDLDGSLTSNDSTALARQQAKLTTRIGNVGTTYTKADTTTYTVGDCDLDGSLTSNDSTALARQQAKLTTRIGNVGEDIKVVKE